jgi:hypothetical protein
VLLRREHDSTLGQPGRKVRVGRQLGPGHVENLSVHAHRLDEATSYDEFQRLLVVALDACLQRQCPSKTRLADEMIE